MKTIRRSYFDIQIFNSGIASGAEDCFDLPPNHPTTASVSAVLGIPNMMFNFIRGVYRSIIAPDRTKVSF